MYGGAIMSRKRTSVIWKISSVELKNLFNESETISDMLKHFGFQNKGSNFGTIKKRLEESLNAKKRNSAKELELEIKVSFQVLLDG